MHRYRAFGLTIGSDVRLDELTSEERGDRPVDLRIVRRDLGESIPPLGHYAKFDFEDPAGILMMWPGAAAVRIVGPDHVEIQPYPDAPERYLAFPLLGPVMGWMLHMRGLFVLHASAVVRKGHAIAFLGDKGAGKSTTASAFLREGAELLTDDLLAADCEGAAPRLLPAFAQLKLNADQPMVDVPGGTTIPLVMKGFEKRQVRLTRMHQEPIESGCFFVLERGGARPSIDWLSPAEALASLIRFSYNVRFAHAPIEQQARARHFRQAAALVNSSRIGKLTIPHEIDRLSEAAALVDSEIGARPA